MGSTLFECLGLMLMRDDLLLQKFEHRYIKQLCETHPDIECSHCRLKS